MITKRLAVSLAHVQAFVLYTEQCVTRERRTTPQTLYCKWMSGPWHCLSPNVLTELWSVEPITLWPKPMGLFVRCERVNSKSIRDRSLILVSQRPSLKQQIVRLVWEVLLACHLRVSWTATVKTGLPTHVVRLTCSWVVWFHWSGWPTKGIVSHWYQLRLFSLIMSLPFTFDLILSLS